MAFFIVVPGLLNKWALKPILTSLIADKSTEQMIRWSLSIFLLIFLYVMFFRLYERRRISELAWQPAGKENLLGFVAGGSMVGILILVFLVSGCISFTILNPASIVFKPLILFILLALMEEILFRGILYRITEQSLGTWIAIGISALLFGIVHITNDHADYLGILSASSAGILLGILYTISGRLWYPISLHIGWNFFQYFLGLPVSGNEDFEYYMEATREGQEWFVGGGFGIENSIITILLVLGISVFLIIRSRKMGRIIRPYWKR